MSSVLFLSPGNDSLPASFTSSVASLLINFNVVDSAALEAAEPVQDARSARVRVLVCARWREKTHLCGVLCRWLNWDVWSLRGHMTVCCVGKLDFFFSFCLCAVTFLCQRIVTVVYCSYYYQ